MSAIVMDIGSYNVKAGFAGEDTPKAIFPSLIGVVRQANEADQGRVGARTASDNAMDESTDDQPDGTRHQNNVRYYVGSRGINFRRDFMELESPFNMESGLLENFDHVERLIGHTLTERLRVKSNEQPILLGEVPYNSTESREKLLQLLFEKFQFPAAYIVKNPVLSCFATGKSTALVIDSGAMGTSVTPVVDGFALTKGVVRNRYGGNAINELVLEAFEKKGVDIKADYMFEKKKDMQGKIIVRNLHFPNTTESYRRYGVYRAVDEVKEALLRVYDTPFDPQTSPHTTETYMLNDGSTIDIAEERHAIPETLFQPSSILERQQGVPNVAGPHSTKNVSASETDPTLVNIKALHLMAYESIMRCDVDIRKDLYATTILTGGNTLFTGLPERFHAELQAKAPTAMRVRPPIASANLPTESKSSVWVGGSILASLGTFQQMWISREEYQENGASIVKKCP